MLTILSLNTCDINIWSYHLHQFFSISTSALLLRSSLVAVLLLSSLRNKNTSVSDWEFIHKSFVLEGTCEEAEEVYLLKNKLSAPRCSLTTAADATAPQSIVGTQ